MSPRRRLRRNKDLVENLYATARDGVVYYRYLHPVTKKWHGLGSDRTAAIVAARQLNGILMGPRNRVREVLGTSKQTVAQLIQRFRDELLPAKKLAPSTAKLYEYRLARIERDLGATAVDAVDVQTVAEYLDSNFERDAYVKHRGTLVELFRFALMKGVYPVERCNPAEITYAKTDYGKERLRMTVEQFRAIHAAAPEHMQIAMELALITLQGRGEVIRMKFSDCQNGVLRVVRQKVQKHEHAWLEIEISPQLESVISRARRSGTASPFIVHRRPERVAQAVGREHWTQLTPNAFTSEFREIRDATGIFNHLPREQRPTFHEIRALGSFLYKKAGYSTDAYIQPLMAHSDEKMTEHYQSGHEQKWVRVRAELDIRTALYG